MSTFRSISLHPLFLLHIMRYKLIKGSFPSKWVWKGDSSDNYSVGSVYKLLLGDSIDENQDGVLMSCGI